jgi:hypothetical protein
MANDTDGVPMTPSQYLATQVFPLTAPLAFRATVEGLVFRVRIEITAEPDALRVRTELWDRGRVVDWEQSEYTENDARAVSDELGDQVWTMLPAFLRALAHEEYGDGQRH